MLIQLLASILTGATNLTLQLGQLLSISLPL